MNFKNRTHVFFIALVYLFIKGSTASAASPDWVVHTTAYQGTMTVTGVIEINGQEGRNAGDMVGVFSGTTCRGVARPIFSQALNRYLIFISIFGNELPDTVTYKIYISGEDRIYEGGEKLVYSMNTALGKIDDPKKFRNALVTGVETFADLEAFDLYPNPLSQDMLFISLRLQRSDADLELVLRDLPGKTIYAETIKKGSTSFFKELALSGLSAGIYFVSISNGTGTCTLKLIRN